jgi:hypothetical protein
MTNRYRLSGSTLPKARTKAAGLRKIDPAAVGRAVGAVPVGDRSVRPDLFEVRHALEGMLRSSGGRPGIASADERVKIPRIAGDWVRLQTLASALSASGEVRQRPSPAQVAAVVLHLALERIPEQEIEAALHRKLGSR